MKMSALKKIGFLFVMLGASTLPQIAFADCGCSSNGGTVLTADEVFNREATSSVRQVFNQATTLFEENAALLSNAIGLIANPPVSVAAFTTVQGALAINSQQLAANIAAYSPTLPGYQFELNVLFDQFNAQIIALAQNAFVPATAAALVGQLNITVSQIAQAIALGLPAANPTTITNLYTAYLVNLINEINYLSTQDFPNGLQQKLLALSASDNIGAYIAIAELIASNNTSWIFQ